MSSITINYKEEEYTLYIDDTIFICEDGKCMTSIISTGEGPKLLIIVDKNVVFDDDYNHTVLPDDMIWFTESVRDGIKKAVEEYQQMLDVEYWEALAAQYLD